MTSALRARVDQTWAAHFGLPVETLRQSGTTLLPDAARDSSIIVMWPAGERIVAQCSATLYPEVERVLAKLPLHHRLTAADLARAWGKDKLESGTDLMYALAAADFRAPVIDPAYTLRRLTDDDQAAFDAFIARCAEEEIEEGDVSPMHLYAAGVLDGERIVSVASTYEWRGFIDVGVLTDPAYRGKNLGKAAVATCCAYHLMGDQVIVYRHASINLASRGIARAVGFRYYGIVEWAQRRG